MPLSDLMLFLNKAPSPFSNTLISPCLGGQWDRFEPAPVARPVLMIRVQLEEALCCGWNCQENKIFIEYECGFVHNASFFSPKEW